MKDEKDKLKQQKQKLSDKSRKLYLKEQNLKNREKVIEKKLEDIKNWEANDDQLTKTFFITLGEFGGHRGLALASMGLSRSWFRKKIASDETFRTIMMDTLEDSEDFVQAALFNSAMNGNSNAALAYGRLMAIEKTKLEYMANQLNIEELTKDKVKALDFVIKELLTNYNTLKLNGRESLALMTLKQIVELLGLTDISELGASEVLKGADLIHLLEAMNIKPEVQDIKFDLIEDEEVRKHYLDMLPHQKLSVTNGTDTQ